MPKGRSKIEYALNKTIKTADDKVFLENLANFILNYFGNDTVATRLIRIIERRSKGETVRRRAQRN